MTILIVDDDREIVELLSIYLRNEGYDIATAYDGAEALHVANNQDDLALVILDVPLPLVEKSES